VRGQAVGCRFHSSLQPHTSSLSLSPRLLNELREYWKKYRPSKYLFPGKTFDVPLSPTTIQKMCKAAVQKAGILKNVTPHTMRHSWRGRRYEAEGWRSNNKRKRSRTAKRSYESIPHSAGFVGNVKKTNVIRQFRSVSSIQQLRSFRVCDRCF